MSGYEKQCLGDLFSKSSHATTKLSDGFRGLRKGSMLYFRGDRQPQSDV